MSENNNLQTTHADFSSHDQRAEAAKEELRDPMRDNASQARDKAAGYAELVLDSVNQSKDKAADVMQQAAGTIRERTSSSASIAATTGDKVAGGIEKAAAYTHDRSATEMWQDFEDYVKKHPGRSIAGALFAGFLVGKVLS